MCKHETHLTKTMHCILISSQCNFPIAMIKKNIVKETYKWKHLIETYSSREIAVHHLQGREHCSKQAGAALTEQLRDHIHLTNRNQRVHWEWQETSETSSSPPSDIPPLTRSSSPYPKNSINWGLSIQTYEPMRVILIETAISRLVINGRVQSHDDGGRQPATFTSKQLISYNTPRW